MRPISIDARCLACGATKNMRTDTVCELCARNVSPSIKSTDIKHFLPKGAKVKHMETIRGNFDWLRKRMIK